MSTRLPFSPPPVLPLLLRLAAPLVIVFILSMSLLGLYARAQGRQGLYSKVDASGKEVDSTLFALAQDFIGDVLEEASDGPRACSNQVALTEAQRKHCSDLNASFGSTALVAAFPFLATFLLGFLAVRIQRLTFIRARAQSENGRPAFTARASRQGELRKDWYAWFHGFRIIMVASPKDARASVQVYMPESEPIPLPGQEIRVYDGGMSLGASRKFGVLYAPHLSVIRGG